VRVFVRSLHAGDRRLETAAAHYLTVVHRLAVGDAFVAFDPEARLEARAVISEVSGRHVTARIESPERTSEGSLPIVLFFSVGKGKKVDHVVREATALGVERIVVVRAQRSVPQRESFDQRRQRWTTIATEAARQAGRGSLPALEGPLDLDTALASAPAGVRLCLDPNAGVAFHAALNLELHEPSHAVSVLVGPEGGLAPEELRAAEAAGFRRVSFGELVLRTETAAVAVLGALVATLSAPSRA
jgi:16S rRNA (uracil1498-N3)-methyltransferase